MTDTARLAAGLWLGPLAHGPLSSVRAQVPCATSRPTHWTKSPRALSCVGLIIDLDTGDSPQFSLQQS